jgi:hypothetical protein
MAASDYTYGYSPRRREWDPFVTGTAPGGSRAQGCLASGRSFARAGNKLVSIVDASSATFDATEAGVPNGTAILVRPDGFVGFRAAPADETTMDALDAHLTSYLVPDVGAIDGRKAATVGTTCLGHLETRAIDPDVWSGRASQEVLSSCRVAVLHQCIRPLIGVLVLPAIMDISAPAISLADRPRLEPNGSPVFARAREPTNLPGGRLAGVCYRALIAAKFCSTANDAMAHSCRQVSRRPEGSRHTTAVTKSDSRHCRDGDGSPCHTI